MALQPKRSGALVLRLIVGLALLGWPRVAIAEGTWSEISTQWASALAVDAAGNLYVAEAGRIQKRDAQGNWSVIATGGVAVGQVYEPRALAVDATGNLYVAEGDPYDLSKSRIQKRDTQGNWSVIATPGSALGRVDNPRALVVDAAGNLYGADGAFSIDRFQQRDPNGNWSLIVPDEDQEPDLFKLDHLWQVDALAVDTAGNLYVATGNSDPTGYGDRSLIQKRDAQGRWSVIAGPYDPYDYSRVGALAVDTAGNLYVAWGRKPNWDADVETGIKKRDAQGNWSVLATTNFDRLHRPGFAGFGYLAGLAVDAAGNLYVADNTGVQKYTPAP
jgi:DNA-binding beta-propeller fold protein YncE